jgi:phage baseplate assembly protein W
MAKYKKIDPIDLETKNKSIGILIPITNDNSNVLNQSYLTIDQIKANIKNLLLTEKGERIMLPTYGLNLKHKLFEVIQEGSQIDLQQEIRDTVNEWMPYVTIDNINITTKEHLIDIVILFSYLSQEEDLQISLLIE